MPSSKVILLVEDNPDDAELIRLALQDLGVVNEVVVARDGQEALDYLLGAGPYAGRNPLDPPGLILLDLGLPKMSGVEVLRRLRLFAPTEYTPVVVITVVRDEKQLVQTYALGANLFIPKPLDSANYVYLLEPVKDILAWELPVEKPA